jgi:hypothetical protein
MKLGDLALYKYENTQAIVKIIRKCQNKKYYVLTLVVLKGNIKINGLIWNCKKSLLINL